MKNRQLTYIHIFLTLIVSISLYCSFRPLLILPEWVLMVDVAISGVVLSGLLLLLRNIIKFSHFSSLFVRQRIINYSALALLFVFCWLGIVFLVLYISVPEIEYGIIAKSIPIRIIIALLVYIVAIQLYMKLYEGADESVDIESERVESADTEKTEYVKKEEKCTVSLERIVVKNSTKIEVIPITEVIYIQAEGDYVMIHSVKGRFLKEQTMKSFEATLPPDKFVRVHRSSIINVDYITQIELYDKQTQLLKLKNGLQVRASLAGYKALKNTLGL